MSQNIVSEHIFIFPFTWKYNSKKNHTLFLQHIQIHSKDFERLSNWELYYTQIKEDKDYNEFVYFYKPIRSALYSFPESPMIVRNYHYKGLGTNSYLEITIGNKIYRLHISSLCLKMYKTGIGLLSFEIINDRYTSLKEIEEINSFSKCIYPPMLPLEKAREELFPDYIKLYLDHQTIIEEDFRLNYYQESLSISPLIMTILGKPFICKTKNFKLGSIFIEPILGNQMFTLCLYKNTFILNQIKMGKEVQIFLERFMMLNKKRSYLEAASEYLKSEGSIYGINRFMLICISNELPKSKLYDQLVSLVLMQRATLLSLSTEIARVSTLSKYELSPAIASIYEIYIQFINQLYFKEITEDGEGAYVYEKLSEKLKIQEELEQLNFEMDEVHEYATLIEQSASNAKVQLLTIIGAALVLPSFVTSFFGMNILKDESLQWWMNRKVGLWLNSYVILPILIVITFTTWSRRKTKKQLFIKILCILLCMGSVIIIIKHGCGL